ncbi:MAG: hypothetical protein P8Z30_04165 [Acidobacteriota bacterium]
MIVSATAALVLAGLLGSVSGSRGQGLGQDADSPLQSPLRTSQQHPLQQIRPTHFPKPNQKQKEAIVNSKFKQLKNHADNLAALANSLQKDIEKSNPNVLSLEIAKKAKEVQKLAKTIEKEAKGN